MRATAFSTAGYRGGADLIDSMHQLRALIFEAGWSGMSTLPRVGKPTNSIPIAPHISCCDTITLTRRMREATARDRPIMMSILFPDLEQTGLLPCCAFML